MTLRKHPERVVWEVAGDGFALAYDGQLTVVVAPAARNRAMGETLLTHLLKSIGPTKSEAWSHGNHPAAARLGARMGFSRTRDLWVMRRSLVSVLPQAA